MRELVTWNVNITKRYNIFNLQKWDSTMEFPFEKELLEF